MAWLLATQARTEPDRPFMVWEPFAGEPRTWSYAQVAESVARIAGGFGGRGIGTRDAVLIHLDNCPEYVLAWFACAQIGAVAVCTNTRSAQDELSYFAQHSGAIAAVTQPAYASAVSAALPRARGLWVVSHDPASSLGVRAQESADHAFDVLLRAEPVSCAACDALSPAIIQYTSGTTGRPKAAVWTHANTLWGAKVNAAHEGLTRDDIHLVYLPMFHVNAQAYSVLATLWVRGTFILQPRFSASRFWPVSVRNRCTWASQIYFALRALATLPIPPEHHYRLWGTGMSGHPLEAKLRVPTLGWWGMTETISHPIVGDVHVPNRPQTIGRAAPEYEVAVLREDGTPVEPGETGELRVRGIPGVSLFSEYLHDEQATESAFDEEGWLLTGDRVTPHADGFFTFADRAKDMLKVGAENVATSEIERVIAAVPGVHEVAVVGAPDPMFDEVPVAFVVPAGAAGDLVHLILAACRAQLAGFKVPRDVRIVAELPRAALEKVAKHKLRDQLRAEGGSEG